MAAPDQVVSFGGQANGAGAQDALFLKVYSGEVMTAFREQNKALDRTNVRTIASGKSAQFPASWKATSSYHTPGTYIIGQQINGNERVIIIDDLAISPVFIASIDEAKSHFEFRSEYSFQCGTSLARMVDKNVLQVGLLAARASATVTGGDGGTQITAAAAITDADTLIAAAFDAAQALDEKNVPEGDRCIFVKPDQYYNLVNSSSKLINRDYGGEGNGSLASGLVMRVAGMEVVKTNNLPQANVATGPAAYQGNFSTTAALVLHRSAVGTVKLIDLAVEMAYKLELQGTLVVAKQALGHGILRPESAVEIKTA
jgi:Phage capsid protein